MNGIEWVRLGRAPVREIECECGAFYRSQTKAIRLDSGRITLATRIACPCCRKSEGNVRAARDAAEQRGIGKKVGSFPASALRAPKGAKFP